MAAVALETDSDDGNEWNAARCGRMWNDGVDRNTPCHWRKKRRNKQALKLGHESSTYILKASKICVHLLVVSWHFAPKAIPYRFPPPWEANLPPSHSSNHHTGRCRLGVFGRGALHREGAGVAGGVRPVEPGRRKWRFGHPRVSRPRSIRDRGGGAERWAHQSEMAHWQSDAIPKKTPRPKFCPINCSSSCLCGRILTPFALLHATPPCLCR